MKNAIVITIIITVIAISFSSLSFASGDEIIISEKEVKGVLTEKSINTVFLENVEEKAERIYDVEIVEKSHVKTQYGIINLYVVTAKAEWEGYSFLTASRIYTATNSYFKIQEGKASVTCIGNESQELAHQKILEKFKEDVREKKAVTKLFYQLAVH
ncbi:MAG: hypothetical protein CR972_05135 [Candidatus Moraniibacteriota bacterium]|nr:MAG: hypothetical protein CR972_05135 [Candidatus Moranbacteria bacterium]